MKKALLIEFDLRTGKRAGNINPKDPVFPCHGWQDLESEPAREIRLIEDDRDISQYEEIPGVTILSGESEINQAITNVVPERYYVQNENLFLEHLKQRNINLDSYTGQTQQAILQSLSEMGIIGINKIHKRLI